MSDQYVEDLETINGMAARIKELEAALREAAEFMEAMGLHPEAASARAALAPEQDK